MVQILKSKEFIFLISDLGLSVWPLSVVYLALTLLVFWWSICGGAPGTSRIPHPARLNPMCSDGILLPTVMQLPASCHTIKSSTRLYEVPTQLLSTKGHFRFSGKVFQLRIRDQVHPTSFLNPLSYRPSSYVVLKGKVDCRTVDLIILSLKVPKVTASHRIPLIATFLICSTGKWDK